MSLSEMLFLGLLGLVIFGPKRLAELGQQAGKTLARWKKISSEFQNQLTTEISGTRSNRPILSAEAETGTGKSGAIVSS
jgi:Sec-independent protein translocase protein TatA